MKEVREIEEKLYFAYGSNMNLEQMAYRCPAAEVVENVHVEGYRLAFCGRPSGNGVATILPEEGSHVDGVLWKITKECEQSLDYYEGYPHLYSKEIINVKNSDGKERDVTVYTINEPYKSQPSVPSVSGRDTGGMPGERYSRECGSGGSGIRQRGCAAEEEREKPPGKPGEVKAPAGEKAVSCSPA